MKSVFLFVLIGISQWLIAQEPESLYFNRSGETIQFEGIEEDSTYVFLASHINSGNPAYHIYERYDTNHRVIYVRFDVHGAAIDMVDYENWYTYDEQGRLASTEHCSFCGSRRFENHWKRVYNYEISTMSRYEVVNKEWRFTETYKLNHVPTIHHP